MAFLLLIKCNNFLLKHVTLLGLQLRFSINDPKFVFLRSKTAAENFNASLFAQHNSHGQPVVGSLVGLYHSLSRISNLINPVFAHHPQGCRVKQIEGGWRSISRRRKLHFTILSWTISNATAIAQCLKVWKLEFFSSFLVFIELGTSRP